MGRMFLFPLQILIPAVLILLIFRFAGRLLAGLFRGVDARRDDAWLPGDSARIRSAFPGYRAAGPRSVEARVFRVAFKRRGRITISDIVLETGLSIKEAEAAADSMVDGMRVRMEVDDRGLVVYEFPEIIARFEDN